MQVSKPSGHKSGMVSKLPYEPAGWCEHTTLESGSAAVRTRCACSAVVKWTEPFNLLVGVGDIS